MLNPSNIKTKTFENQKNGYSIEEVTSFLKQTANDYAEVIKANQDSEAKIIKLVEKVNELMADKDAITDILVQARKEAKKIVADAKTQAAEMIDGAKTEQVRLAEQSAAECERIVKEHKEKCAQLIRDNTEITEKKINSIREAYDDELSRYETLQAEVTYFKANLTGLYNEQIKLIMNLPTMTKEELDEYEAQFDDNYAADEEYADDTPAEVQETEETADADTQSPIVPEETTVKEDKVDKILNTGSFEPVIPKSSFNDLKFGKNN